MAVSLENVFSPEKTRPSSVSEIRAPHATVTGLAGFESGEGLVDLAHWDTLGFCGKRSKRHAETSDLFGESGLRRRAHPLGHFHIRTEAPLSADAVRPSQHFIK